MERSTRFRRSHASIFVVLTIVGALGVLEAAGFLMLWARDGQAPTPTVRREALESILIAHAAVDSSESVEPGRVFFDMAGFGTLHPYLGYSADPDRVAGANRFGFTGGGAAIRQRSRDTVLVGVVGGSVAEGFTAFGMEALRRRLAEEPAFRGREIVPINLAFSGYKQPQQLMAIAWVLSLGGELDYVVNIDGFNEIALHYVENARKQVHPAYPQSWFLFLDGIPERALIDLVGRRAYLASRIVAITRAEQHSWRRVASLSHAVWDARRKALERERVELAAEIDRLRGAAETWVLRDDVADTPYRITGVREDLPSVEATYEYLTALWSRGSVQLDRLCRANGIRYLHFLQPNQYLPGSKPMGAAEREIAWRADQPYRPGVERGYPLLRAAGERLVQEGVRFEDLTQLFADVTEPMYFDDCCHFKPEGYDLIADAVARAMREDRDTGRTAR